MKIRLRYFGMIADRLGKTAEEVEWEGSANPIDPRAWLLERYPALAEMSWKVAVDQEIVDGTCFLRESSEIVVLPPFAGG
ncbi:MAG: molybdopterin converting factor subunit 1 [Bacteroidota bacterium]|jgi:molybdopterin synthase sulfur carrier subunit